MADQNPADTSFGGTSILSRVASFRSHRYTLLIQLLDETEQLSLQFKGSDLGQKVLDSVCGQLDIIEKDYFGLRYQGEGKHRYWLDLTKPLNKQFKDDRLYLSLRFRFYPRNPFSLKEHVTRYQLFVQLRRDLLHGRLYCPQQQAINLAALVLQAVLGDYDENVHLPGYVSEYKLLLKQTERLEERIAEAHKQLAGMSDSEAEAEFLTAASQIQTYGFDPYGIKDASNNDLMIGATCHGILVFSRNLLLRDISWEDIVKYDYSGRELKLYPSKEYLEANPTDLTENGNILNVTTSTVDSNGTMNKSRMSFRSSKSPKSSGKKKEKFRFYCPSTFYAKHLWRHLLSQHAFYTEEKAKFVKPVFSKPRIPILLRGSTFRLPTRKVLHEIEEDNVAPRANQPVNYPRYPLPRQLPRSELEMSMSSRTATLRSTKQASKALSDGSVAETLKQGEETPIVSEVMEPILTEPATSTPKQSSADLTAFVFTPTSVESTGNQILDSSLDLMNTTTSVKTTSDESIMQRPPLIEIEPPTPLLPSSPIINHVVQTDETAIYQNHIIPNGTPKENATANGHAQKTRKIVPVSSKSGGVVRKVMSFTLLLTFVSILVVTSFEVNNGYGAKWTRDFSAVSSFRQIVYDPAKDYMAQLWSRWH